MSRQIRRRAAPMTAKAVIARPMTSALWRAMMLATAFGAGLAATAWSAQAHDRRGAREPEVTSLKDQGQKPKALSAQRQSAIGQTQRASAQTPSPPSPPSSSKSSAKAPDWSKLKVDPSQAKLEDGRYVQTLADGTKLELTLEPATQQRLTKMLASRSVAYGSVVLLEPETGRVLAMVSEQERGGEPAYEDLARRAPSPSASVFKVVTIAALLEEGKVKDEESICYHGGRSSLSKSNIVGDPKLDRSCGTLSDAMAWSINSIIAKLAYQRLDKAQLDKWAERFGYNQPIPFEMSVERSVATMPEEPLERARAAAGFWHTTLSPLHGAMIGAAILNDGVMMAPALVERVIDPSGKTVYQLKPKTLRRVVSAKTAATLRQMMDRTTSVGTARSYFRQRKEFPSASIATGGKTGTLSRKTPSYLGYTWFVGYGQSKEDQALKVAVAGLLCNKPIWQIKGPYAASEAVRIYQSERKRRDTAQRP